MTDVRLKNLAKTIVEYSCSVKPGDWVHIRSGRTGLPMVKEIASFVLKSGGNPTVQLTSDEIDELIMTLSGEDQLRWKSPAEMLIIEKSDVFIHITAPENTRSMSRVDPERQRKRESAHKEWLETFIRRSAAGDLRWVMTNYPCDALAQEADMSLQDYENFVFQATFSDREDPVDQWRRIHSDQERLVRWLDGKKRVKISGPNADITFSIESRKFINSDGKNNMPSGEIFTGPVEDSVSGWVAFTYPAITHGREVSGIRLEFREGLVTGASAEKNEEFLLSMLDTDAGSRKAGEFGIGTNFGIPGFTRNILFDEKIGGTFHLALGYSIPETGGVNVSSIHWDLICDARTDTEIRVDGESFYRDGKFMV